MIRTFHNWINIVLLFQITTVPKIILSIYINALLCKLYIYIPLYVITVTLILLLNKQRITTTKSLHHHQSSQLSNIFISFTLNVQCVIALPRIRALWNKLIEYRQNDPLGFDVSYAFCIASRRIPHRTPTSAVYNPFSPSLMPSSCPPTISLHPPRWNAIKSLQARQAAHTFRFGFGLLILCIAAPQLSQ